MKWYHGTKILGTSSIMMHAHGGHPNQSVGMLGPNTSRQAKIKPDEMGNARYYEIYFEGTTEIYPGDKYFNWDTGHIYICTTNGYYMSDAYVKAQGRNDQAKWRYDRTQLMGPPDSGVANLSVSRNKGGSRTFTAKWKVPDAAKATTSKRRAESVTATFVILRAGNKAVVGRHGVLARAGLATTTAAANLSGNIAGKTYARKDFYPLSTLKLWGVGFGVRLCNNYAGNAEPGVYTTPIQEGPTYYTYCEFRPPRKPTLSAITQNMSTGVLSCTIKTNAGEDLQERYDTYWKRTVYNSRTRQTTTATGSSTSTSFNVTFDASDRMQLDYSQYIKVTWEAWARGYAGDSEHVSKTYYVSRPPQPTITSFTAPSRATGALATVNIKTNATTEHPVTGVRLQKITSVSYTEATQIPADAWDGSDTAAVDNGSCTALSLAVEDLVPLAGTRTWVRIKCWREVEDGIFVRYSEPRRLKGLETPYVDPVADDTVAVRSLATGSDGESARLVLAWKADDSNATEVSWAADADTWDSTEEPSAYLMDDSRWAKSETWTKGGVTYAKRADIIIRGLTEGEPAFVRARRALVPTDQDGSTTYGPYCSIASVVPANPPTSAVLSAPAYAVRSKGGKAANVTLSWTHEGGGAQRGWEVRSSTGSLLASGNDASESCRISLASTTSLYVRVRTAGGNVSSGFETVEVGVDPTVKAFAPDVVEAQSPVISFMYDATDPEPSYVSCTLSSLGSHGEDPAGDATQVAGEVVWTDAVRLDWYGYSGIDHRTTVEAAMGYLEDAEGALAALSPTDNGYADAVALVGRRLAEVAYAHAYVAGEDSAARSSGRYASFRLPDRLDLRDLASYELRAQAVGGTFEQLASEVVTAETSVMWAHQAPVPPDTLDVVSYDETDEMGVRELGATIELDAPTGAIASDTYDVYRVCVDGVALVAEGVEPGKVVRDRYAPYGDATLAYRVALRTADGDVEWRDVWYRLDAAFARIDWEGGYVELPLDLAVDHRYSKDFEARHHVGQALPEGYWGEGRDRSVTITADLVRSMSESDRAKLHELGSHAGPCLVRCADGSCFEAHVECAGMPVRYDSAVVAVSLSCVEVAPSGTFLAGVEEPPEEEEEEES